MLIKCNDKIWTEQECNELIKRANEIYMSIRRVKMLGDNSSEKIQKLYEETEKGADAVTKIVKVITDPFFVQRFD